MERSDAGEGADVSTLTGSVREGGCAAADYRSDLKPIWCPGCGDFGVLSAIYRALAAIGRPPHEIAFVSGIGCSSRIPGYTTAYGFNSVHGRALPIAQGIKLANPDLLVLVAGGDGDGFSIGGGHLPHVIRRNIDLTYIVMDNQIYGLTKGQLSPTSPRGLNTVSSTFGSLEQPVNPLLYVLGYGAGFVAQGTPADMGGLASLIEAGIRFPGFAFINVQSPCITFGPPEAQLKAHKTMMEGLAELGHDAGDRIAAMTLAQEYGSRLFTGVFYRHPQPPPAYGDLVRERQRGLAGTAQPPEQLLSAFLPKC
jgi:2-oxoglutarate/2-oxoacid ferredoxin oxidoreductase subunit beta